jgi:hypothetical protein
MFIQPAGDLFNNLSRFVYPRAIRLALSYDFRYTSHQKMAKIDGLLAIRLKPKLSDEFLNPKSCQSSGLGLLPL